MLLLRSLLIFVIIKHSKRIEGIKNRNSTTNFIENGKTNLSITDYFYVVTLTYNLTMTFSII